ncbi:Atypical chemokine receptor 3 [Sciurus carolinensis]|uniref:Atypical chemokine receptor 3 n=1 Tax=Sciurus carolinensis TaxID=30640 RepID=A0AA41SQY6_SCICA|nr:Atypical chemokine receptor 3 [Sciurus carolinensis]
MGELTCKVTYLIFSINLFGSIFFLTCISMDHYLSITYFTSTSSHRKKMVHCILCVLLENALFTALHAMQCLLLVHCCINSVLYSVINHICCYKLMKVFDFKYSAKKGLSKVMDTFRVSETECLALERNTK